ncbi:unnamed protein product [Cylicocyclus nassatus]|uniref:VWFA domain-containing protein n=1 Tax=Cylicocyclus nassatus TaxID=53992 RepID=A0AA36MCR1_CYLNA|nr:unnamed protein product [Cylicocyclus nassatus]
MEISWSIAILLGQLLFNSVNSKRYHYERECQCTPSKLWLDVVVLFDNSLSMEEYELGLMLAETSTILDPATISRGEGHHCRVGTITYGGDAKIRIWEIGMANDSTKSLTAGLLAADQVFREGRVNGLRKNVKEVIIVYATDFNGRHLEGAKELAHQLKKSGKNIIIVAFEQGGSGASELMQIASEGFYFTNRIPNLAGEIQHALCDVNCFCYEIWVQYKLDDINYGSCLRIGGFKLDWENAHDACKHLSRGRGHLATAFDIGKHNFTAMLIRNDPRIGAPYKCHIGSDPEKICLKNTALPLMWNQGFPDLRGNAKCVLLTAQTSAELELGWQNEVCNSWSARHHYVCQMDACDTDNYCLPN